LIPRTIQRHSRCDYFLKADNREFFNRWRAAARLPRIGRLCALKGKRAKSAWPCEYVRSFVRSFVSPISPGRTKCPIEMRSFFTEKGRPRKSPFIRVQDDPTATLGVRFRGENKEGNARVLKEKCACFIALFALPVSSPS
jgi:hypothetical protein